MLTCTKELVIVSLKSHLDEQTANECNCHNPNDNSDHNYGILGANCVFKIVKDCDKDLTN